MTYKQACQKARRLSKRYDREYYVIWDTCEQTHEVADDWGLDTFYLGISESNILTSSYDLY